MLFCFTNIYAESLLHVICAECQILAHSCQMLLTLKALKIICTKVLGPKMLVKLAAFCLRCYNPQHNNLKGALRIG
jgi:hypothetical protein